MDVQEDFANYNANLLVLHNNQNRIKRIDHRTVQPYGLLTYSTREFEGRGGGESRFSTILNFIIKNPILTLKNF